MVCLCVCACTKALLYTMGCLVALTVHSSRRSLSVVLVNNAVRFSPRTDRRLLCLSGRRRPSLHTCLRLVLPNNGPRSPARASFTCTFSPGPPGGPRPSLHVLQREEAAHKKSSAFRGQCASSRGVDGLLQSGGWTTQRRNVFFHTNWLLKRLPFTRLCAR